MPEDITFHWLELGVVTAKVSVQSALPEAFTISGYVDMMMSRSMDDGSWFTEVYDDYTTITYNYADSYFNYAGTMGVDIESEATAGNGYVAITVMPIDFTDIGSDPTRDSVVCYLEPYTDSTDADVEYRLWDGVGNVQVYLNNQMEPISFFLNLD